MASLSLRHIYKTDLNLEFIPLSELPGRWDQTQVFDTPSQNL